MCPSLRVCFVVAAAIALLSCTRPNPLQPLLDGKPYILTRINGDSVPWFSPFNSQILAGWIKLDDDTLAERHEETSGGPTAGAWTATGRYTARSNMLVIHYIPNPFQPGPLHSVDTFFVSGGGLVMREKGYPAPLDTMVRFYAKPVQ